MASSIVDYLKKQGKPADYNSRVQLAQQYGIQDYRGSADQNIQLLGILQSGAQPQAGQAQTTPALSTKGPSPSAVGNIDPNINKQAEQQTIARFGYIPKTDEETALFAKATYAPDQMPKTYQDIIDKLEAQGITGEAALQQAGTIINQAGQQAVQQQGKATEQRAQIQPGLNVLQQALKMTSGVGNQPIGESDLFKAAGLSGYSVLAQSLDQRSQEIDQRYESFANVVNEISSSMIALNDQEIIKAQTALQQYEQLRDDYKFEAQRFDQKQQQLQDYENRIKAIEVSSQANIREYEAKLKLDKKYNSPVYNKSTNTLIDPITGEEIIVPGRPSARGNLQYLGGKEVSQFADNCVKFAREFVPNLPFGLFSKEDKQKAVDTNIIIPQIGDAVLTGEGQYGHAAVIIGIEGEDLILQEANYISGQITQGRKLSMNNSKIYGYISNTQSPQQSSVINTSSIAQEQEGYNPAGIERFNADSGITRNLTKAFDNALSQTSALGVRKELRDSFNQLLMEGDIEGAKEKLFTTLTGLATAEQQTKMDGISNALEALNRLQIDFGKYREKNGNTNIFKGNLNKIYENLGLVNDPELSKLANSIRTQIQLYRQSITGAAFNALEQAEFEEIFPSTGNVPDLNSVKFQSLIDSLKIRQNTFYKNRIGSQTYEALFGEGEVRADNLEFNFQPQENVLQLTDNYFTPGNFQNSSLASSEEEQYFTPTNF